MKLAKLCGVRLGAAALLASVSGAAIAQTPETAASPTADEQADSVDSAEFIVVQGTIGYRNRTETAEPILEYGTDYFQRFEPLTIGDALKRVPSVTFQSDVIESDGARLRGLDPSYTQVLINGEKVPGPNADRTFFLDRIPAEMVDRIEIVRSSSARRTGDAVAGTLNIVLRDAFELDGGYVKGGGVLFDDGEIKPVTGGFWGGAVGPGRLLVGGNVQGRYNPKQKTSLRFDDDLEFDNREDQDDTRDGTDYSFNASYGIEFGDTKVELGGFYFRTDRTEHERSLEYNVITGEPGPLPEEDSDEPGLLTDADQSEDIDQQNYSLAGKLRHEWSFGKTSLKVGYARFRDDTNSTEVEIDFDQEDPEFEGTFTRQDIVDREFSVGVEHAFPVVGEEVDFAIGTFYQDKDRDTDIFESEFEDEFDQAFRDSYDQSVDSPTGAVTDFSEFDPVDGGLNTIQERRLDLFGLLEGKVGLAKFEVGVRYETTKVEIDDLIEEESFDNDYEALLPSASVKLDLTSRDRVTASVARTMRRPQFDFISPALLTGEFGDNDLRGNPLLKPEKAWGIDIGYERKIGATGVAGVNVFYRKIEDLIELVNTGEEGDEGPGTFIFQPENVGDGDAWGIEFDLSASLGFIGLEDTGIFGNLALIDSEVEDFLGSRRFNGQPKYVYNFGFIQNLRSFDAAFGATYRKQGSAKDRFLAEEVKTTYGADLEIFVEKRLWNKLTVRAVGSNLLNARKEEEFLKFDTEQQQVDREFQEFELESEKAGPVFQLVARLAI